MQSLKVCGPCGPCGSLDFQTLLVLEPLENLLLPFICQGSLSLCLYFKAVMGVSFCIASLEVDSIRVWVENSLPKSFGIIWPVVAVTISFLTIFGLVSLIVKVRSVSLILQRLRFFVLIFLSMENWLTRFYPQNGICIQIYNLWPKNDGKKWSRKNIFEMPLFFSRPLFTIIFRPEMLKFYPYTTLTEETKVEFVIYHVLRNQCMIW